MPDSPIDKLKSQATEAQVIEVLRSIYDPEIPVNIYDLGLIYSIEVDATDAIRVRVQMTLTSPNCPVAGTLPPQVEAKIQALEEVAEASVEVVWEPTWTPQRMSEAAKLELGMEDPGEPRFPRAGFTSMTVNRSRRDRPGTHGPGPRRNIDNADQDSSGG